MHRAIWYHYYILKTIKNTHGGVLLLIKVTLLHGCFSRFFNLYEWYQIVQNNIYQKRKPVLMQISQTMTEFLNTWYQKL